MQQTGTSSTGRSTSLTRRVRAVLASICLAVVAVVVPGAEQPAHAADGLSEESHARYHVGARGKVTAEVTTRITNVTPDRGDTYYYWDAYNIPVPSSATDITATSGGASLTVRLDDSDDVSTQVAEVSFSPLRYGRTRTIEWTYRIAGDPVRDERWSRVGPGYATFPVQAWGDEGRTSVSVEVPSGLTFDSTDEFEADAGKKRTTYTIDANNQDGGIWSAVSVRDPGKSDEREVTLRDGVSVAVQGLPGDTTWLDFAADRIEGAVPELERLTGTPWPVVVDVVREDVSPQVLGYAWFDQSGREIVVGEELDEATLYHELGHAWFDGDRFDGRWLYEGLTEVTAYRVIDAVDGEGTPRRAPQRTGRTSFPLLDWSESERDHETDDYGYPAAYTAVHAVLGDLDDETFTAVVSAALAGEDAYGEPGTGGAGDVDWRKFLDLAAERGGVDGTEAFRTWVVGPEEEPLLDERTVTREAFDAYDEADGDWQAPRALRRSMRSWEFADATAAIEALRDAAPAAVAVQAAAAGTGLAVPASVRDAYERSATAEEHAALPALLDEAATTMTEVGAVSDAVAADRDPVSELGEDVLGAAGTAGAARTSLADGDLDAARSLAAEVRTAADRALWVGLAVLVGGLVLLVLLVLVPVVVVRRRRRRRPVLTEPQVIGVVTAPDPDRTLS